jgi:hypothetical protein
LHISFCICCGDRFAFGLSANALRESYTVRVA